MEKVISKIIGAVIVLAIAGVLLYVFLVYILPVLIIGGLLFFFLRKLYRYLGRIRRSTDDYLTLTFVPLGYITSRSSSAGDLKYMYVDSVLEKFDISLNRYQRAREFIEVGGKSSAHEISEIISKYRQYWENPSARRRIFISQISVLFYDNLLTRSEINLFFEVANWYCYTREEAQALLDSLLNFKQFTYDPETDSYSPFGFGSWNSGESESGNTDGDGYGGFGSSYNSARELEDAYRVLGIDSSTSDNDARHAYKKLMSRYHPDKAIAQGLGDDGVKRYTELSQKIGKAWDTVKQYRHIK
jgi:DnaJ like chaperone protein